MRIGRLMDAGSAAGQSHELVYPSNGFKPDPGTQPTMSLPSRIKRRFSRQSRALGCVGCRYDLLSQLTSATNPTGTAALAYDNP